MVRSFDRRIESRFYLADVRVRQQAILILEYNLRDTVNAYELQEDGTYLKCEPADGCEPFDMQKAFFEVTETQVMQAQLFDEVIEPPLDVPADLAEGTERTIATI